MLSAIFCPNCNDLILDQPTCPACGWRRPAEAEGAGQLAWCADLGTRLVKPHCYPAVAAGRYCLGSEDGVLLALDLASGQVAWEQPLGAGCMAHGLASDGTHLCSLEGHTNNVQSVVFSPDGQLVATGSSDGTIKLWQVSDGKLLQTIQGQAEVLSVDFSPDGTVLAAGSKNGLIRLFGIPK
jgi:WD40 repeat protein